MKSKKRERLEVIYDILHIVQDNHNTIKPTRLLRTANLSSKGFMEYYQELLKKGFLKEELDKKGKKYVTLTDKGFAYLQKYHMITGFIEEFQL